MSDSVCQLFGKQCAIFLGVVVILLLNVMEVLSVGGGAKHVCCTCDPSVHLYET